MYVLLDTNVTAGYYLPRSLKSKRARKRIENIFDSVRSGATSHFFYLPNFCVAETFSVFMKYSFGAWNRQVRPEGTIDTRVYRRLVQQFQEDIHNGKFIYHYELSRYHVLAINLVAPVDHYFQISRKTKRKKKNIIPSGTFDHLIISMGIHLAHIHGNQNVVIVSTDERLTDILSKCKSRIPINTLRKLKLASAEEFTGRKFAPTSFPLHLNLAEARKKALEEVFGQWPLPVGRVPKVYRWLR